MFLNLTDCLTTIFHFLTIYDICNIFMTCSELRNSHYNKTNIIWYKLFKRDYYNFDDVSGFSKDKIIKLEYGLICIPCFIKGIYHPNQCYEEINIANIYREYYIRKIDLLSILSKKTNKIRRIDIMKFLVLKFNGMTNYFYYKKKEIDWLRNKQNKQNLKRKLKYERFQNWKLSYTLHNLRFINSSNAAERLELLQLYFQKLNLDIRKDSKLCNDYLDGNVILYCPEFISGAMKITSYLFSYHFEVYNEFHTNLINSLMYKMFLRQKDSNFTIKNGIDFVIKKNEKRVLKYIHKNNLQIQKI